MPRIKDLTVDATPADTDIIAVDSTADGSRGIAASVFKDYVLTDAVVITGTPAAGDAPVVESIGPTVIAWQPALVVVDGGSTAATARPTGAAAVWWVMSVQPDNWVRGDAWLNTGTGVVTGFSATTVTGVAAGVFGTLTATATGSVPSGAPTLSFLQTAFDETDLTEYTFASQNLGSADADRAIIVAVHGRDTTTTSFSVSSVTVGGVSASVAVEKFQTSTNGVLAGLWIVAVPTGTTGDVVVTFSTAVIRAAVALYRVVGLSSLTASDTSSGGGTGVGAMSTTACDIPANGIAIGASACGATTVTSAAWSGLTEDYDTLGSASFGYSGASTTSVAGETGPTLSVTWTGPSGANNEAAMAVASWA